MNVLLIGSGGREHALALALAKSPLLTKLFAAPGNPGTAQVATNVALDVADARAVIAFCQIQNIGFVVIGPEQPLVDGLVDALEAAGIKAFGPSKLAARLEGSKGFTKDLCAKYGIPTGAYARFTDRDAALAYLRDKGAPIVVKADGLAAGKGVTVALTLAEAESAVNDLFGGAFGAAGAECVIEEFLDGEEASFFALCDGDKALAFASAQDHKRVGDGDTGPNTGGMGAYSPAPVVTDAIAARVMDEIVNPTVAAMKAEGCPFKGVLFVGLMIGEDGPKLIEFNTRFGDPECQVMLARLEDDLLGALLGCAVGNLPEKVHLSPKTALTVVMAARGYPGTPKKGGVIAGIAEAETIAGVKIVHAGTKMHGENLVANGGRVLNVVALADSVFDAQNLAYRGVDALDFPDGFCRRDIGWRAIGH
ncbi:phosphoribosylamine--glycine ligase [Rhodoblastus sphagnicola]|uniref:Phosphoribosylamine--glycine ligase n=1 Tax=Rhodoblastus sphagnicola TaxID=333368 RepID=A0A2S6N813_9HYPH|nr:phosphoribosylamine--glycine ligase [Rhodoblastus sphagnicola]MBB4197778.1 phosphoribosylamine--glycine ligase [Rhodoblastus sphagnicola]PPQ30749.1 phosphoribosylamine--glycine ligase [Rhodoblastus sphagnicola]